MKPGRVKRSLSTLAAALLAAAPLVVPAAAQDVALTSRVGTLEKQMKAVQRKVFPGGDARYFTPDIASDAAPPAAPEGTPATSPVADLAARVDALERQQRTLTGAVEEAQNTLRQLSDAFAKYRGDTDFRLNAIEHPGPATPTADAAAPPPATAVQIPAPAAAKAAVKVLPPKSDVLPAALPVEDQWRAAYALYTAKDYAKAEAAMTDFLAANPTAARASNAQYWLGRSYMAEEKFTQGAKAFLDGYKKYPKGDRAADSLLWLGNALIALKKPEQACTAFNELAGFTGAPVSAMVKAGAAKARKDAKCDG